MIPRSLRFFPKLNTVLTLEYSANIEKIISSVTPSGKYISFFYVYLCFVDVCISKGRFKYDGSDIITSEKELNFHISSLIGFVYKNIEQSNMTLYIYCNTFKKVFSELASSAGLLLKEIMISDVRLTKDVKDCISLYKSINSSSTLISYYSGWPCENKSGKLYFINLANFYDIYGAEYTTIIHNKISDYAKKHKTETIQSKIYMLVNIFNEFTEHCSTVKALEDALKPECSSEFMEKIMNSMFFKSIIKNNDTKNIIRTWTQTVSCFNECFIDTGFYSEPLRPFLLPEFKEPRGGSNVNSFPIRMNESEQKKWFAEIPLEIRDEDALNIIHRRLVIDLKHILTVCKNMFDDIKFRLRRNGEFKKNGSIKPLPHDVTPKNIIPMGAEFLANTIATFYHHGFGIGARTTTYLGFDAQGDMLLKELCLPNTQGLYVFAILLVLEHPQITPSWFQEWELFDKNGNLIGVRQVGNQWVAVSLKNRRGAHLAQQEIILTNYSKDIVDTLIDYTQFARDKLRAKEGSDWRYAMLTANLQGASRPKNIASVFIESNKFRKSLAVASYNVDKQLILCLSDAEKLASVVSLRSVRQAKAIQIYLETQSINAVSEALGHQKVRLELIETYLPKSLMDYFNNRWVRQFQNAIVFEALKNSPYLFDALDFDESALEEFLRNHSLGDLPLQLEQASNRRSTNECLDNIDELVFTLSTPLFQVLIAIHHVINNAVEEDVFLPVINRWYQSANFILEHFSLSNHSEKYRRAPEEIISLYKLACSNPLDLVRFKEQILCR